MDRRRSPAGQKAPQEGAHPAIHAGKQRSGNILLTIPTYLRLHGDAGPHRRIIYVRQASVANGVMAMAAKAKPADKDADENPDDEAAEAAPKSKFKFALKIPSKKMMIIGGAVLVVLAGGGTGAWMFFGKHGHEEAAKVAAKPAVFVDMPDVLVNLSNTGGERTQYLKVKIVLELPDQKLVHEIQPLMPRVVDAFQTYLRELRPTDLDGSAGLYRLKEELTRRVNAAVAPNHITAVLFKEIIVQ